MRFIEVKAEEIAKNAKKYDGKEVVINYYGTRSKKRCNSIIGLKMFDDSDVLYYYFVDDDYSLAVYGGYCYNKFIDDDDGIDRWKGTKFYLIEDDDK